MDKNNKCHKHIDDEEIRNIIKQFRKEPITCLNEECGFNNHNKCMTQPIVAHDGKCLAFFTSKRRRKNNEKEN